MDREVDVSRGCVFEINENLKLTNSVEATLLWMDDSKLENGKNFFVKIGTKQIPAIVSSIKYAIDVNSGEHKPAASLSKNEIALVDISFSDVIVADEFKNHKVQGELILIDRITNMTSACGVITAVHSNEGKVHVTNVDSQKRAIQKGQSAKVFEFLLGKNGVSSSLLQKLEKRLYESMRHTYLYTPVVGEDYTTVVNHLVEAGLVVLLAIDEHVEIDEKLRKEKFYVTNLQENLTQINLDDVTEQIKKLSSIDLSSDSYCIQKRKSLENEKDNFY